MTQRRGIVLASVAVIGAASIWLAAALVQVAAVSVSASDLDVQRSNAQLRVQSAVRVLLQQLADQRDALAAGMAADLPQETTLWTVQGRRIVVQLLGVGDQVPGPIAEGASLDANHATADAMSRLEHMDQSMADAVVAARDAAPDTRLLDRAAVLHAIGSAAGTSEEINLTVYAHAPMHGPGQLTVEPWSDDLASSLRDVLSDESIAVLASLPEGPPETFATRVAAASPTAEMWGAILQHTAPSDEGFLMGRIDLAGAPASTLATLPGIDGEQAFHLVAIRDTLPDELRATLSWPWTEAGLSRSLEPDLLPLLTVGSWTWRCTIACGEVMESDESNVLLDPIWAEVVFDVAGEVPRVAMLRRLIAPPGSLEGLPLPERPDDEDLEFDVAPDVVDLEEDMAVDEPFFPDDLPEGDEPFPDEPLEEEAAPSAPSGQRVGRWR